MLQYLSKNFLGYLLVAAAAAILTYSLAPSRVKVKKVTEVKERVRTRTRIVVKPDGTSITTIDELKDTLRKEREERRRSADMTIFATRSVARDESRESVYGVGVSKELILGLGAGVYGRTDKEFGVVLSYSF